MSQFRRGLSLLALALCTSAVVGCGDSTGPGAGNLSDPAGLSADVQSLEAPLNAPAMQSFSAVALSSAGTPVARTVSMLAALSPGGKLSAAGATEGQAYALRALRPSLSLRPSFAVIPAEVWGKVYVWDEASDQYVEGPGTGPANGVRFILYAVNPLTQQPAEPVVEVGYADFLDQSSGATNSLRVQVVGGGTTYADYVVSGTSAASSFTAAADGYITDGTHRLDFTADLSASGSQVSLDYALSLDQPAITAHLQLDLGFGGETATLTTSFAVTRGGETVVLAGTLTVTSNGQTSTLTANFSIQVNGGLFATITAAASGGTAASYTVTGPGGRALTDAEREALDRLFEAPSELTELLDRVFHPVEAIFGEYTATL
ncbi:MAG TPA: hypothetical protein VFU46_11935 [Gemmatimonadales bacterium]|nr:hypothetical protein [Gemmatimonadales bacterium]